MVSVLPIRTLPSMRSSLRARFLARALPRPPSSSLALFLIRAFSSRALLILKRPTNILGQEIGLVADFFPVEPSVYALDVSHLHKLDFRVVEKLSDEVLGCNSQINEVDFYKCAKSAISKQIVANSGPDSCKVPMFEEFYTNQ